MSIVVRCRLFVMQGNSPGPTLIYAQTTNEVDTLAAHLQAKGVKAVK